jgi:hypothetical protein
VGRDFERASLEAESLALGKADAGNSPEEHDRPGVDDDEIADLAHRIAIAAFLGEMRGGSSG